MDATVARNIAHYSHLEARDRHGDAIVEHVTRVAAAVPPEAEALAWLHDVLEASATSAEELAEQGISPVELEALRLLTHQPGESYELYVLRIAHAPGPAGRLARIVKIADLDDHIAQPWTPGAPPYGWARRHIEAGAASAARREPRPATAGSL